MKQVTPSSGATAPSVWLKTLLPQPITTPEKIWNTLSPERKEMVRKKLEQRRQRQRERILQEATPRGTGPRTPGSAYPDSGETKARAHGPGNGCSFWFRSRNHSTQGERWNPTESPKSPNHSRLLPQLPAVAAGRTSRYLRTTFWAIA